MGRDEVMRCGEVIIRGKEVKRNNDNMEIQKENFWNFRNPTSSVFTILSEKLN